MRAKPDDPKLIGRRLGYLGVSYAPWLDFAEGHEWIKFMAGWRQGRKAREKEQARGMYPDSKAISRRRGHITALQARRFQCDTAAVAMERRTV